MRKGKDKQGGNRKQGSSVWAGEKRDSYRVIHSEGKSPKERGSKGWESAFSENGKKEE